MMTVRGLDRDAIAVSRSNAARRRGSTIALTIVSALLLSACVTPSYIDKNAKNSGNAGETGALNPVIFQVTESYEQSPPDCIAVMPFHTAAGANVAADRLFDATQVDMTVATGPDEPETDANLLGAPTGAVAVSGSANSVSQDPDPMRDMDRAERVRRSFYSHLSPQNKRDVELALVDRVIAGLPNNNLQDYREIGSQLHCDALLVGIVTEYDQGYFGLYSRVSVGAEVKLISASSGEILWEGRHVAESHGGSVPLTPIGAALSIVSAVSNIHSEQVYRVTDDLARRLVATIPDDTDFAMATASGSGFSGLRDVRFVQPKTLNFRTGPGFSFGIQGKLNQDQSVEVVGRPLNGGWVPVRTADGLVGYVSTRYLGNSRRSAKLQVTGSQ